MCQVDIASLRLHIVIKAHTQYLWFSICAKDNSALGRADSNHRRQPDNANSVTSPDAPFLLCCADEDIFETVGKQMGRDGISAHLKLVALLRPSFLWSVHDAGILEEHVETGLFGEELLGGRSDGSEIGQIDDDVFEPAFALRVGFLERFDGALDLRE